MSPRYSIGFSAAFLLLLVTLVVAQDPSIVNPTTAAPSATAVASASGYTYMGCYNETARISGSGGERALTGGKTSANDTMTVASCLEYCSEGDNGQTMQYAGLEYGRECYCGAYLSILSEKLDNASAHCVFACEGNASQVCGGPLALTLYNLTQASKTGVGWSVVSGGGAAWYGTAAIVTLLFAALL